MRLGNCTQLLNGTSSSETVSDLQRRFQRQYYLMSNNSKTVQDGMKKRMEY